MADAALRPPDNAQPTGLTTPLPSIGAPEPAKPRKDAKDAKAAPAVASEPAPVTPLKRPSAPVKATRPASRPVLVESFCDLCGTSLDEHTGHYYMVSPLTARKVAVCRTCRRAALGEGYRPRA